MPFLTDLKLPEYVISLTIPTQYNDIINERLATLRDNLFRIHDSEQDQYLIEKISVIDQTPFVKDLENGNSIETQERFFRSPWQLATSLHEMLHLAIQQQINQERESSIWSRSDLEDFLTTTGYGIKENLENTTLRIKNAEQLENAERENAMEALEEELAELDEAMRAVQASYTPNTQDLAIAAELNEESAEELALEEVAQKEAEESAERDEAMRAVPASYTPNSDEQNLADKLNEESAEELALKELAQKQEIEIAERDEESAKPSASSIEDGAPSDKASTKSKDSARESADESDSRDSVISTNNSENLNNHVAGVKRRRQTNLPSNVSDQEWGGRVSKRIQERIERRLSHASAVLAERMENQEMVLARS
jgi:hypothetical protein